MICKDCGTAQAGRPVLPGNGWIELVLWLCWLLPGVIYSIWRRSSRSPRCATCGSQALVAESTPVGRRLAAEHYPGGIPAFPAPPAPARTTVAGVGRALALTGVGLAAVAALGLLAALIAG